jgi:hypothetical protein
LILAACQTIPAAPEPVVRIADTNFAAIRSAIQTRCLDLNRQAADANELQIVRNDLVTAYMVAADIEYGRYETNLLNDVRSNNLAASLSILILSSVAGVVGDRQVAQGLTTATGIIAGGQKSYTTDQLLNETVSVLQQQMQASRAAQRTLILSKLGEPYAAWNFCLALQDAQAYERAGTLNAALAEIAATASESRRTNEAAANSVIPMIPFDRGPLSQSLKDFAFPPDRALWQARLAIIGDLIQTGNLLPLPNSNLVVRRSRILFGSGAQYEEARRQLAQAIIDDSRADEASRRLLREALAR